MMRNGGTTGNGAPKGRPMKGARCKCNVCHRDYAMTRTRDNHERLCKQHEQALNKWAKDNPERAKKLGYT